MINSMDTQETIDEIMAIVEKYTPVIESQIVKNSLFMLVVLAERDQLNKDYEDTKNLIGNTI